MLRLPVCVDEASPASTALPTSCGEDDEEDLSPASAASTFARLPSSSEPPSPAPAAPPEGSSQHVRSGRREPGAPDLGCGCFAWLLLRRLGGDRWWRETTRWRLGQLQEIGLLGCGAFGSVTLVRCRQTGQTMALKSLSKGMLVKRSLQKSVASEKQVMQKADSPFIVKLLATFDAAQHLHFLMEAAMGGDLFTVYCRHSLYGSAAHARFYAACAARALEHLHGRRCLYRDLKMENLVLDCGGYAKLCDFGLATCLASRPDGRARTVCGTLGYMAPEVAGGDGYSYAVDWWGLGILVFELMRGTSPFSAPAPWQIHAKVAAGIESVTGHLRGGTWLRLVRALCCKGPGLRLPMLPGGLQNVEEHAWFHEAAFPWAAHRRLELAPPHAPEPLEGAGDLRHFSPEGQSRPPDVCYESQGTGWTAGFEDLRLQ